MNGLVVYEEYYIIIYFKIYTICKFIYMSKIYLNPNKSLGNMLILKNKYKSIIYYNPQI